MAHNEPANRHAYPGARVDPSNHPIDFKSATRKELFDWMNEQIRSGNMTIDESTPFLAMTLKMDVRTGQPVDMATDTTRVDFMQRARQGIEGAEWRSDPDAARRLQAALGTMQQFNMPFTSLDVWA